MKKYLSLLCSLFLLCFSSEGRMLSDQAEIMIVTCGPYQGELYSAFGHSAIRVYDPKVGINYVYNYGVFDDEQPNFYLGFAMGNLNYQVARSSYSRFLRVYIIENRYVNEQVLNLSKSQKQRVFDFLEWNIKIENKGYLYDYFYNNCATKLKDVLVHVLGDSISFNTDLQEEYSIRELTDLYLKEQPWGDFGIDICLGLPMDKKAAAEVALFLPDYLQAAFDEATIIKENGDRQALVKTTMQSNIERPQKVEKSFSSPLFYTLGLMILGFVLTLLEWRKSISLKWFDFTLLFILGLTGCLLFLLWVATEHKAAAYNLNLIWALPFHLPAAISLLKKKRSAWLKNYFKGITLLYALALITWVWLPQKLHFALIPLVILLLLRAFRRGWGSQS